MNYFMILDKKSFIYTQKKLFQIVTETFEKFDFPIFNVKNNNVNHVEVLAIKGQDEMIERLINVPEHLKELSSVSLEITNSLIHASSLNKLAQELSKESDGDLRFYSIHVEIYERNIYLKNAISGIFAFREQLAFLFNDVCGQCITKKRDINFNRLKKILELENKVQSILSNCNWLNANEIKGLKKVFDELSNNDEIKELIEFRHAFTHRTSFAVDIEPKVKYKKATAQSDEENEIKGFLREMFTNERGDSLLSINPSKREVEFLSSEDAEKSYKYDELYCKVISVWKRIIDETTKIIKDIKVLNNFIE